MKNKIADHTPGPWLAEPDGAIVTNYAGKGYFLATAHHTGNRKRGMIVYSSEGEANARLIAAAPELLFALKHAVGYIREFTKKGIQHTSALADLEIAEAAIAKAEGRE